VEYLTLTVQKFAICGRENFNKKFQYLKGNLVFQKLNTISKTSKIQNIILLNNAFFSLHPT
jgi:hypothetical protein